MSISSDNVGRIFTREGKTYILRAYAAQPTAMFEDIETGEKVHGGVGSPFLNGFEIAPDTPAVTQLAEALQKLAGHYNTVQAMRRTESVTLRTPAKRQVLLPYRDDPYPSGTMVVIDDEKIRTQGIPHARLTQTTDATRSVPIYTLVCICIPAYKNPQKLPVMAWVYE